MEHLLLTGATGFLGKSILPELRKTYQVDTLGTQTVNNIVVDLTKQKPNFNRVYTVVVHAAGKAHMVPQTVEEEQLFYNVNYHGTVNLCSSLEKSGVPKSFIFISTVAVYGTVCCDDIDENYPLNGKSPYAMSKIMAEDYLIKWCFEHNVTLTILRPPIIVGKNAPGNLAFMIKGIAKGFYFNINGGTAKKSMLMVDDIAKLIPLVQHKGGIYNISDSQHPSFGELSCVIASKLHRNKPHSIPYWIAWIMAKLGDIFGPLIPFNSYKLLKMTNSQTFSNKKACTILGWTPMNVLDCFEI